MLPQYNLKPDCVALILTVGRRDPGRDEGGVLIGDALRQIGLETGRWGAAHRPARRKRLVLAELQRGSISSDLGMRLDTGLDVKHEARSVGTARRRSKEVHILEVS